MTATEQNAAKPIETWLGTACIHAAVIATAGLQASVTTALAHDAPSGWAYPIACCSGYDCRAVSKATISEKPEGYVINATGEIVGYADRRVRVSEDEEYHWCSIGGKDTGSTICLFVPARLY